MNKVLLVASLFMFSLAALFFYYAYIYYQGIIRISNEWSKIPGCDGCLLIIESDSGSVKSNENTAIPFAIIGVALLVVSWKWEWLKTH
jgi:hypothetical protein